MRAAALINWGDRPHINTIAVYHQFICTFLPDSQYVVPCFPTPFIPSASLSDAHHRLVITDTQGDGAFLLAYLPARRYILLTASKPAEERRVWTEAERDYCEKSVIFYTTIPQKNRNIAPFYEG